MDEQTSRSETPAWGPLSARLGVGGVLCCFGIRKLDRPQEWIYYLPTEWLRDLAPSLQSEAVLESLGILEVTLGALILLGFATRWASAASALLLAGIVMTIGLDGTGVRDLGLMALAISLLCSGGGRWSLDALFGGLVPKSSTAARRQRPRLAVGAGVAGLMLALSAGVLVRPDEERSPEAALLANLEPHRREPIRPLPRYFDVGSPIAELGKRLFHETTLSGDGTLSCASCHDLNRGGADARALSVGMGGAVGAINAPTVFNAVFNFRQFWDGRAEDLIEQASGPVANPIEMGADWDQVVGRVAADGSYREQFSEVFGREVDREGITEAIAAYERSLITANGRFDRWLYGEDDALSEIELEGYRLFKSVGCVTCHQGINAGGNMYQTMGKMADYFADRGEITEADYGRYNVTGRESDRFRFKVPTLRNVAETAPYFHDGQIPTLLEAVQKMARYQLGIHLRAEEGRAITAFLKTLSGELPPGVKP